jgi:hypothetical protein
MPWSLQQRRIVRDLSDETAPLLQRPERMRATASV